MGNVWDAMNKHKQEQERVQKDSPEGSTDARKVPGVVAETNVASEAPDSRASVATKAIQNDFSPLLVVHHDRGGMFAEQYRSLRTNILARSQQGCFCMGITSAESGEGKTVTSLNLALVLVELPGVRVVVVDGDLRKGTLTSLLNVKRSPGFAELLKGDCPMDEVIQPTSYPNLDVISCGIAKSNELGTVLGNIQKSGIIAKLQQQYDCVLVDTPAVGMISDACVLAHALGEVLLVIRMHKTNRSSVERTVGLLKAADVKISGMFLTHQKEYVPTYFGRYY